MKPRRREDTGKWEVRFREGDTYRSRSFDLKGDAEDWIDSERRRRQLGWVPSSTAGRLTLSEFVEEWWRIYAIPNLKPRTRATYGYIWERHMRRRLGGLQLRELSPALVEDFRAQLHAADVGEPTIIKAMGLLQGILKRAVLRGLLSANPVLPVDKPKQRHSRRVEPLAPAMIEAIRDQLDPFDATLISMLGYGGCRPDEAIRLRVEDLGQRSMHIDARKTGRERVVRLLAPLAQDLREYQLASGVRRGPLFPRSHGGEWKDHDWRNWRRRVYQPAAATAGVIGDMRPYRLRGSFVSLLLWEGRSIAYVAQQAGHSVATLSSHYAGVLEELEERPKVSAESAIRQARDHRDQLALEAL